MSTLKVDTITGKTTAGTVAMPAGMVVQCLEGSHSNWTALTSASYVYANVGVGITPKFSTSKIQVFININGIYGSTAGNAVFFELYRDIGGGGYSSINNLGGISGNVNASDYGPQDSTLVCSVLDSPSTTSAVTYRVYARISGGGTGGICNYIESNNGVTRSSAVAMEISQ